MSALTVLQAARDAGTAFEVNGDRLTVDIPETAPDRIVDLLRAHKAEIITLLRAEALVDEAWRAGIIFRLVDPRPREIAERRPFSLRIRYPKGTPRSLIYMLRAARAEIYTAFTPADPVQNNPQKDQAGAGG